MSLVRSKLRRYHNLYRVTISPADVPYGQQAANQRDLNQHWRFGNVSMSATLSQINTPVVGSDSGEGESVLASDFPFSNADYTAAAAEAIANAVAQDTPYGSLTAKVEAGQSSSADAPGASATLVMANDTIGTAANPVTGGPLVLDAVAVAGSGQPPAEYLGPGDGGSGGTATVTINNLQAHASDTLLVEIDPEGGVGAVAYQAGYATGKDGGQIAAISSSTLVADDGVALNLSSGININFTGTVSGNTIIAAGNTSETEIEVEPSTFTDITENTVNVNGGGLSLSFGAAALPAGVQYGYKVSYPLDATPGGNFDFEGNTFTGDGSASFALTVSAGTKITVDTSADTISIGGSPTNAFSGFNYFDFSVNPAPVTFIAGSGTYEVFEGQAGGVIIDTPQSGTTDIYSFDVFNETETLDFRGFAPSLNAQTIQSDISIGGDGNTTIDATGSSSGIILEGFTGTIPTSDFIFTAACYLRGTRIATPLGDIEIELLSVGDSVLTASGATCTIRWIGHRAYRRPFLSQSQQPVCIAAGGLGDGLPQRDLYVSPRHAMWVAGRLIAAEALVNHTTIRVIPRDAVEYLHIELDTHELLLAEGAPSESYCDTGNRFVFDNADTAPARSPMTPLGPRIEYLLPAQLTHDPGLRVYLADGAEYLPAAIGPGRWCFALSGRPEKVVVRSRSAVPAHIGVGRDERRLGVALHRVVLRRDGEVCELEAGHPSFLGGFHAASDGAAWTDGEATLALSSDMLPGVGPWQLELHGSPLLAYQAAA